MGVDTCRFMFSFLISQGSLKVFTALVYEDNYRILVDMADPDNPVRVYPQRHGAILERKIYQKCNFLYLEYLDGNDFWIIDSECHTDPYSSFYVACVQKED